MTRGVSQCARDGEGARKRVGYEAANWRDAAGAFSFPVPDQSKEKAQCIQIVSLCP